MGEDRSRLSGAAHVERVRLTWWTSGCNRRGIHWGATAPVINFVTVEVLGVYSRTRAAYNVQGVLPLARLPEMNDSEKNMLLMVLRDALVAQMSQNYEIVVNPIKRHLVDWEAAPSLQETNAGI